MDTIIIMSGEQQLLLISINKMKYDEGYNFLTEVTLVYHLNVVLGTNTLVVM